MEKKSRLKHLFVSLMMMGCTFGVVSCSDDDDPVTTDPTVEDVVGDYSGKMYVSAHTTYAAAATEEGTDVDATVKNDTVYFKDFPVKDIVASIVPEEMVESIMEAIGKVEYGVGYKATMNTEKDSIFMEFSPKPLELKFSMGEAEMSVKVDVSAAEKGSYSVEKKKMKFAITADEVTVNEEPLVDFYKPQFSFDMNQK